MRSRRKICSKTCRTDVVPAPDEPVTEMIGWWIDMVRLPPPVALVCRGCSDAQQAAPGKERRTVGHGIRFQMMLGDPLDLVPGTEDERRALVQMRWLEVEDAAVAIGRGSTRLFDQKRHRVGLVDKTQPAGPIAFSGVAR